MRADGIGVEADPVLDPGRIAPGAEPSGAANRSGRTLLIGILLSLSLHLFPAALLWERRDAPPEMPPPIPIELVFEQQPPPPPVAPPAAAAARPPPGRLASEEMGALADQDELALAAPPEPLQTATLVAPPKLPEPEPLDLPAPVLEPPPEPAAAPPAKRPTPQPRHPDRSRQRAARSPGPAATRDEYLAHLVELVRPHLRLLTPSVINGRRGKTSLAIRVLGDGTIARIAVSESSGHPDIDAGVMRVIAAVGRFPPLPQWIQAPAWDINFHLRFPFPDGGTEMR